MEIPFLKAYKIWSGGSKPIHPYYYIVEKIKGPDRHFTYMENGSLVKCAKNRWVVDKDLFDKASNTKHSLKKKVIASM